MIRSTWDTALYVLGTTPEWVAPVALAWLAGVLLTQAVKASVGHIPEGQRNLILRMIAFCSSTVVCWALWSDTDLPARLGMVVGPVVGLAVPLSWAIATRLIGRRWPHLRDILAADGRAKENGDA